MTNRPFHPSPTSWQDEVLYFLMIDRFSNGKEQGFVNLEGQKVESGTTPPFSLDQAENAVQTEEEAAQWRTAGNTWCGGNLNGIRAKLGYLKRLGITTMWLSPVLKQTTFDTTSYHGYGTQNFLAVDPRFGSSQDLQDLVAEAHQLGLFVILDIVVNHAGFVFEYQTSENSETQPVFNQDGQYPVAGYHDSDGQPTLPFGVIDSETQPSAWPDGAIWPRELQDPENFNRRGCIGNWENEDEYLHGDFKFLKDFYLGEGGVTNFHPSKTLQTLTHIYQYWLAYADLDGYRLDAVKHMEPGASKYFVDHIHRFARSLGKTNFYIMGEVAGGQSRAHQSLTETGLDAALGILDIPSDLENMVKGLANPNDYFQHVTNKPSSNQTGWLAQQIVTLYDDHDQIRKNFDKARFAAGDLKWTQLAFNAAATLVCSTGIPCLYYGSEQGFDGAGSHDRYIRECMFGGEFGAFRSKGHHFFDEHHPIYQNLQRLLKIRQQSAALRQGDQQLLEISGDGEHFGLPTKQGNRLVGVIPWLRWTDEEVVLCAFSTDSQQEQTIWVRLPQEHFAAKQSLLCRFCTQVKQENQKLPLNHTAQMVSLQITVPQAGFIVLST